MPFILHETFFVHILSSSGLCFPLSVHHHITPTMFIAMSCFLSILFTYTPLRFGLLHGPCLSDAGVTVIGGRLAAIRCPGVKLMGGIRVGRGKAGYETTDQSLVAPSKFTHVMFRGDLRDARERGFCAKRPVFRLSLPGVASLLGRRGWQREIHDGSQVTGGNLPEKEWRGWPFLTTESVRAGIGISVSLLLSPYIVFFLLLYFITLCFLLPFFPSPRLPTPSSTSPSAPHGRLIRLLKSPNLLHPKRRPSRRRSLCRRLQRILPIHPQRDKTPQEDDPGPA